VNICSELTNERHGDANVLYLCRRLHKSLTCRSLKLPHNTLTILDFQELLKFYAKNVDQGLQFVFYKSLEQP